ncbi:TPA: phage integrase family protein [Vibrio parahaemolyticus]|uniref:tyrosine-type recombinase/integrase n=1 Tax=Vibrio harveyi group TaxID=717610 RepID=UPI0009B60445|nr:MULTISPECIES: tyrosine-type recombinase/integrase [Vibrio harveyi group]MBT0087053.1 tyrosine-type recombinase/integrase [Vibrio alginolyticus]OQK31410.1 hypothetical protein XM71_u0068 [Vibrio parahaemolyticus]HAS3077720.1 phage integrase family protein [Vibrio parahaemolyticus]HAS3104357.1 phage integrase family protein [Vibrio parahaemolyticus]HCH4541294.1 tyrosine-type recombinase/integrase [Vibrio parahaemolyticus]
MPKIQTKETRNKVKKDVLDQSFRYLRSKYLALSGSRHKSKRPDKSSAPITSVRNYQETAFAIAHAVNFFGLSRLKHLTEAQAIMFLVHRRNKGLADKSISRDRVALQRLIHRRLPSHYELHLLSSTPVFSDQWLTNYLTNQGNPREKKSFEQAVLRAWKYVNTTTDKSVLLEPNRNQQSSELSHKTTRPSTRPNDSRPLREISRAYTQEQILAIAHYFEPEKTRLAILIAYNAGLRVSELITLRREGEGDGVSNQRDWLSTLHSQRGDSVTYIVTGKGGLIRRVSIDRELAIRLEALRLNEPREYVDRKVKYLQYYNLTCGNNLSKAFSRAAVKVLGFSKGAHGTRHSYAQERMKHLVNHAFTGANAKHIVSQELGHMRQSITNTYLR